MTYSEELCLWAEDWANNPVPPAPVDPEWEALVAKCNQALEARKK